MIQGSTSWQQMCCSTSGVNPIIPTALEGREKNISFTARQWSAPGGCDCAAVAQPLENEDDLDYFLRRAKTHTFSVSGMAFQDAWNLDLQRLQGCCIHVVSPEGNIVPFCAYNLTASDGRPLHRRGE